MYCGAVSRIALRALVQVKPANQAIKFAPFGRRTLVPRAVYGER